MYVQLSSAAVVAAIALALPMNPASRFTLASTGAVTLNVTGKDARFGVVPAEAAGYPRVTISLGATSGSGSLTLSVRGDRLPPKGRYSVDAFQSYFVAGTVERPLGWFLGESGWVRITETGAGRVAGEFEIRARGFTTANPDNEDQWVTVRGSFAAQGDGTVTTVASRD